MGPAQCDSPSDYEDRNQIMPSFALILEAIVAVIKFPAAMESFIKLFRDSPEEKRQKIEAQVSAWAKESAESERPVWK